MPYFIGKYPLENSKPLQFATLRDPYRLRITTRMDISPDGKLVAAAVSDFLQNDLPGESRVDIYDAESGGFLGGYPAHHEHATGIRFSPDAEQIATVSWDGTLQISKLPPLSAEPQIRTRANSTIIVPSRRIERVEN